MAKQLTEDELNIRRKARRRLIGAIALTLAVVVILPMVLDNEPKPSGQDIDLHIPDPDKAGEFVPGVDIPEESELPPSDAVAEPPVVVPQPAAPAKEPVANGAKTEAPKPAPAKPAADAKPKTKTESKPKAVASPKPAEKPSGDGFVAQAGAYSSADTAKQELARLKQWGFKAYTEKAGDKIRVRVGPYAEREKAEKVAKMLEKHGLKPVVMSAK